MFKPTIKKVITWDNLNNSIAIEALLKEFLELNKNLYKRDADGNWDEGPACAKKFTNHYTDRTTKKEGNYGVPAFVRDYLNALAKAIFADEVHVKEYCHLGLTDVFVLLSNHLDQQNSSQVNPMPTEQEKQILVLNFLKAAYILNPAIDYTNLSNYSVRYLSSHAQLLFYLGKALRYEKAPLGDRLAILSNALKISQYLSSSNVPENIRVEEDVHGFQHRDETYSLPISHCLRQSGRFEEASELVKPQLQAKSQFHRVLAACHLSEIYFDALKTRPASENKQESDLKQAFIYAHTAVNESKSMKTNVKYNALICLMKLEQYSHNDDNALKIAEGILDDHHQDEACGARATHLEAAQAVVENQQNRSFNL